MSSNLLSHPNSVKSHFKDNGAYLCFLSPDLNTTPVQCALVPAQTCVDLKPEVDGAGLEVFPGFAAAVRTTGFSSLLTAPIQRPSVERAMYTVHVRKLMIHMV